MNINFGIIKIKSVIQKPGLLLPGLFLCILLWCMIFMTGCGSENEPVQITVIEDPVEEPIGDFKEETPDNTDAKKDTSEEATETTDTVLPEPSQLVWATYWDTEGLTESLNNKSDSYDAIGFFAAYYDENAKAFIPEGTVNLTQELKALGLFDKKTSYLTFVNDQTTPSGSKLKDSELVYSLIGSDDKRMAHIDEVIAMTKEGGYGGIEIDYEAIKNDMTLWNAFVDFIKQLYEKTTQENLKLRVLFEPGAPIDAFDWPKGPEYVMMCYNLYGYGTNPGPKADPAFLKDMVAKMEPLGDNINFALANGGFDWTDDGGITQIQNPEIEKLINTYGLTPVRDNDSFDMVISFTDDAGLTHTIWYADDTTIEEWKKVIKELGHEGFSLWRLP